MRALLGLSLFINELMFISKVDTWEHPTLWAVLSILFGAATFSYWASILFNVVWDD